MVGIVEEQHGERARLFAQWKGIDWPIMIDALNLHEVPYVPITLLIDEYGVIRKIAPPMSGAKDIVATFLATTYDPPNTKKREPGTSDQTPESALVSRSHALVLWEHDLNRAIASYENVLEARPDDHWSWFRLGVAYRLRFDSSARRDLDFRNAVAAWQHALDVDPNNYIHRRRIQQYGPRLNKPYPFYDWIHTARDEIDSRGETPHVLVVEPGGAEFASPSNRFENVDPNATEPDPGGRVARDASLIAVEATVVPAKISPGKSVRVHVDLRPNEKADAHWNNEVEDVVVWIDPPKNWIVQNRHVKIPVPTGSAVSAEERRVEFEIKSPDGARGAVKIPAYALYYVCEGRSGTCLYRRQDIDVIVEIVDSE